MSEHICVKVIGEGRKTCGEPATNKDIHGRELCADHYASWHQKLTESRSAVRIALESYDLAGLSKLLHLLETDTGTAMDVALAVQDSKKLLNKLKEVLKK